MRVYRNMASVYIYFSNSCLDFYPRGAIHYHYFDELALGFDPSWEEM